MTPAEIKWLHVEASSKCNAWCPSCPRNNNGFGLKDNLVELDLSPERFAEVLDQLPGLADVQFCGNLGDPLMSKHFDTLVEMSIDRSLAVHIHTNGSLRNEKWWTGLADKLSGVPHAVWFGIDGLEDTHAIYRQGTDFNKIIRNATSFIKGGGTAIWQFIPYLHNQHQLKDCVKMSSKLGFQRFKVANLHRSNTVARNYKTGEYYRLDATTVPRYRAVTTIDSVQSSTVPTSSCMHLSVPSIYLGANGTLSQCCYKAHFEHYSTVSEVIESLPALESKYCVKQCGKIGL